MVERGEVVTWQGEHMSYVTSYSTTMIIPLSKKRKIQIREEWGLSADATPISNKNLLGFDVILLQANLELDTSEVRLTCASPQQEHTQEQRCRLHHLLVSSASDLKTNSRSVTTQHNTKFQSLLLIGKWTSRKGNNREKQRVK